MLPAAALAVLASQSFAIGQGTEDAFVAKIPGQSMTSSITLALSDGTTGSGQTVEIPLNITSLGTAVPATFQIDLGFDQQKLTFAGARAGAGLISGGKTFTSSLLANGDVRLVATGMNQNAIPNGLVAYASFTLKAAFLAGSSPVVLKACTSGSALGSALSTGCTAGNIKLFSCDLNADSFVNVLDVQLLVNEVLGYLPPVHDLNHDGKVNVADVQKLINAVFGQGCPY